MRGSQPPVGDLIRLGALTWAGGRRRAIAPKATRPLPLTNPERHRLNVKRCPPADPGRAGVNLPVSLCLNNTVSDVRTDPAGAWPPAAGSNAPRRRVLRSSK